MTLLDSVLSGTLEPTYAAKRKKKEKGLPPPYFDEYEDEDDDDDGIGPGYHYSDNPNRYDDDEEYSSKWTIAGQLD